MRIVDRNQLPFGVRFGRTAAPEHAAELSEPIICVAIVLGVYHLGYDLLLLVPLLVALVRGRVPEFLRHGSPRRLLLVALVALAANYASTQAVIERLGNNRAVWLLLASVNPLLLVAVFAVCLAAAIATLGVSRIRPVRAGEVAAR